MSEAEEEKGRKGRMEERGGIHLKWHTTFIHVHVHVCAILPDNSGSNLYCLLGPVHIMLTWSTSQTSTSPLESLVSTCCLLPAIRYSLILLPPVGRDTHCKSLHTVALTVPYIFLPFSLHPFSSPTLPSLLSLFLPMQCHPKSKYQETEDKLVHHLLPAGYMLTLSLAQNERGKPPPTLNLSCSSQGSTYSMYMHAASIVTWSIVLEFQTQL